MGKKRVFLYGAALVLAGCVGLAGFRLASGQELYKAPELTLLEGQADFDLLEGIEYDAGQYELRVDDLGEFDVNRLGEYWVGYVLTPKAGEQGELLPVAQAAEVPDADPVSPLDGDPEPPVEPQDPGAAETEPPVEPQDPGAVETEPPVEPQDPGTVETEPPVEPQDPGAVETEPPVEPQDPGAVETEPPVESQDPDAVETELPLETPAPETVRFQRRVSVISAINEYKETIRMVLGAPVEAAAGGITAKPGSDNYDITVALDGFNPNEVGEYRVTYILTRRDTGAKLRDFQRWVQVTKPDVDFTVDEEPLVAPAKPETAEADFWLSGITYDETRYTLVLRDDPAALIPNWAEPQRLVYELWEGDPNALPAGDAAPAMYADPSAGDSGPSAGDTTLPAGDDTQPAGDDTQPTPELAAVFGRDVYTTGEMEEEPKESEKPEERKLAIVAPPLVIYLEDVDPDNPQPIDLLDGVEVIDEATGDPVVDAVVAVSNPGELADAVVDNTGGGGLLNGGMGDPGMDGPGPGAGDPVPEEPENTGYNMLDPTALTEGEYEVELAAADPETGEQIIGVRTVSVQPRAATGTGFAIGLSNSSSTHDINSVVWFDWRMETDAEKRVLDKVHPSLKAAIDDFKNIMTAGFTSPVTGRPTFTNVASTGNLTFYLFGDYTLTADDVTALKNFSIQIRDSAGTNRDSWLWLTDANGEIRYHNANAGARLRFGNGVDGLELPENVNRNQGFYWNVVTTGNKYIAGTGNRRLTMAPTEYGGGRLIMTGGPSRYGDSNVNTNFAYAGVKGSGNSATPTHVVAAGLLYKDIRSTGDWTNAGTLSMTVSPASGINVQTIMTHAQVIPAGVQYARSYQNGRVNVTLNSGSGETDVYLGYTSVENANNIAGTKTNVWCNLYLENGAKARNVYGLAMAYNAVGAASTNNQGVLYNGLWVETRAGSSQITGSLNGFHGIKVVSNSTLTCGNLDYTNYGSGSWGGEVQLDANATLILTNRNGTQKAGKLQTNGANATLAVPTPNDNSAAATPLVLDKNPATVGLSTNKLTLRGSQTGYSGRRNDVVLRFTTPSLANKNLYNLHSSLSNVERLEHDTAAGTVYLVSDDRWQAYYEANGSYQFLGNYLTLGNALNAMKSDAAANSTHRVWRLNMLMDYTLNDNDRNTMSTLQLQNVDRVTLEGKTADGVRKKFTAVGTNFLLFPQGNGTGTEYVMRDFTWNDSGKSAIVANGSKLIIEGQWSGTENCHVAGGGGSVHAEGDESQKTVTHNGATDVTVRNTGSGWASIVGGNLLLKGGSKNVSATSIVNGATRVTVDASWPIGLGISPGCLCLGYDCDITLAAGGSATITGNLQKGSYTSNFNGNRVIQGHITHFGFTDTNRLKTFTADADVSINLGSGAAALSITGSLPVNVAEVNVWPWDFLSTTNTVGDRAYPKGSGRLIVSVNNDLTLASGTQIKTFDELRVAAGKTLTFASNGGSVNYSGRDGKLVLGAGSTVELQTQSTGNNNNALKLGGITLNGNATLSFPKVGSGYTWAPVRVTKAGGQLTANGHKLTLQYNPNVNSAHRDVVLEFAEEANATASLNHLTAAFPNGGAFLQDGRLVRVDREFIALDYANADGTPLNQNSYTSYFSLKEAIDQFKADGYSQYWRISLLKNYTLTEADARALTNLNDGGRLTNGTLLKVYLAGRRLDTEPIKTLTLGNTLAARILRLPEGNAGAPFVMKDFNVAGGPGAIVANGRTLTIEGAWNGNDLWYVAGGKADWYEGTGNTTLTYNGATNLTVKNTGSGWAAIAGGNLIARGNGGTQQTADGTASSTVGATNLTVHAGWGTHFGITPGCLYIGCNVGTTTLTAGGTATLTGKVEFGHIAHFAATDRTAVGACDLRGNAVINLGSAPTSFTIGSSAEMNVKTHGAISGGGKLILSVNGECLVEDGSNVMKTFDELRVSQNQTLTFAGDGGWIKHNNRDGLLVLAEGSTLKLNRIGGNVGSTLHVRGIQLDGNANLQYPRMNGKDFAPVVVDSGGALTAATGRKLTVSYLDSNNQAEIGDCLLKFATEANAATALPFVEKGFANTVHLVIENGVIKVGMGRVLLTCYNGTYGQYFSTLKEALEDIETRTNVPGIQQSGNLRSLARITFVEDYTLTAEDVVALKDYSRPGNYDSNVGLSTASILKLTSQFVAGAQIPATDLSWPVLNYPVSGATAGTTVRRTVTIPADIREIILGVANHEWENLDLRFEGDDTEIFANGSTFAVKAGVNMMGGRYPTLYGGGVDDIVPEGVSYGSGLTYNPGHNTVLNLSSGTWKAVYGGGKGANALIKGKTYIEVNGAGLAAGGGVYGGGKEGDVNGNTEVKINSGTAAGGAAGAVQGIKIVAGGATGNVDGKAILRVNGGISSAVITLQGVESGDAGSTDINVNLGTNLSSTASQVTLNVYAGPRTEAKTGGNVPADNVVDGSGKVSGDANVSIWFQGQNRPNLGTVCGLKRNVLETNNEAEKGTLTLKGSMTVKEVIWFETLNIGDNSVNTGAVTVTGRLDSDPNKNRVQTTGAVYLWPFDRSGSLILKGEQRLNLPDQPADMAGVPNNETGEAKVGKLITTSNQAHLHIGRRKTAVNQEGKGIGATNPLYVTLENGTTNPTTNKLRVGTPQGTPRYGEILITFPRPIKDGATVQPSKDHYQTDTEGWILSLKEGRFSYNQGQTNVIGSSNTSNIIYAKSIKLSIEAVKVTPTRAEDASLVNPGDTIGWTVELEMMYYKNDGHNNFTPDTTVTQPPQEVYVDTNALHDDAWFEGTGGLPAGSLASTTTFSQKPNAAGVFTATLTIPPQEPFTYGGGGADLYYYVHCKGEHNSAPDVRSIALDLHAPQLTGGNVTSTSNGQGVTEFTITAGDVIPHNAPQGEIYADETHSAYTMSNLTLMAWSVEEKRLPADVTKAYFDGLAAGQGGVMFYNPDGTQNPAAGTFTVNKAQLPDPNADAIYVYLQDRLGNTRIVPVVLSMHQLDLEIPTRVGVVLVKNGTHTLSPVCKITNRSMPYVKVELVGYTAQTTNQHSLGQTLVNNTTIGLAIGNSGEADSIGSSINVQDLPWRPYASLPSDGFTGGLRQELAILGPDDVTDVNGDPVNRDHTLSFKFQGNFNRDTALSDRWNLFYLTYRFTVVDKPPDLPANP